MFRRITLGLVCCLLPLGMVAGCAGPMAVLADHQTQKAIDKAAADPSFPSAAEAGLAAGSL